MEIPCCYACCMCAVFSCPFTVSFYGLRHVSFRLQCNVYGITTSTAEVKHVREIN